MLTVPAVIEEPLITGGDEKVLMPATVCAVVRSTKFFVVLPVPPDVRANAVVRVTDVNDGLALSVIAGVVPPEDERLPDAVTDVTGVVTKAALGTVAAVSPAPEPEKLRAVTTPEKAPVVAPVMAPRRAKEPFMDAEVAPYTLDPVLNAPEPLKVALLVLSSLRLLLEAPAFA